MDGRRRFLDFFAGSGLVTEAVSPIFDVVWANDVCAKKAAVYRANHGGDHLRVGSIERVHGADLPDADLSWASFPCQDLSLAGAQAGIAGARSGLVREWLRIYDEMPRKPKVLIAENVGGLLSANGGVHYRALHAEFVRRGLKAGAMVLDARDFLPQSRGRVFIVACGSEWDTSAFQLPLAGWPHSRAVLAAASGLPNWVFWRLPPPEVSPRSLADVVEWDAPTDGPERASRNLAMIPARHRTKLTEGMATSGFRVAPGYKRTRAGKPVLELRFDGIAGCLRTPEGGSSRQLLVLRRDGNAQDGGEFTTRLLTAREAARLMGAPESYRLPTNYNDAYKAMGDAVAVPVARHLALHLLKPLADAIELQSGSATPRVRAA